MSAIDTELGGDLDQEELLDWLEDRAKRLKRSAREGAMPSLARQMMTGEANALLELVSGIRDPDDDRDIEMLRNISLSGIYLEKELKSRLEAYDEG